MRTGTGENNFRKWRPRSFYAVLVNATTEEIVGIEPPPQLDDIYQTEPTVDGYIRVYPIDSDGKERVWRKTYSSAVKALRDGLIYCATSKSGPVIYERASIERVKPTSNWIDSRHNAGPHGAGLLAELFGQAATFLYPKSIYTIMDIIDAVTYDDDEAVILDFFAGSGTTAHAVINLNRQDGGRRRYILVEMADYFETVLLPRVKKVVFSDSWKDGKAQNGLGISHFVKYFRLEQYEETLRRACYRDAEPLFIQADPYSQYVFLRDTKMLDNAQTGQPVVQLDVPNKQIHVDVSRLYEEIDLAETLSCLTGKPIRRIHPRPDDSTRAGAVEFADGERVSLVNPPWDLIKPLVWW